MKNNNPLVVVCDIDGTISLVHPRRAALFRDDDTDWDAFYEAPFDDEPIVKICSFVRHLSEHYRIIFCTSRRDCVREKTLRWLQLNLDITSFPNGYELLMRASDDPRPDTVVKPELIETVLLDGSEVLCVLEDSASMSSAWTRLGYTCLQVA